MHQEDMGCCFDCFVLNFTEGVSCQLYERVSGQKENAARTCLVRALISSPWIHLI